jgi:hypothetical protein
MAGFRWAYDICGSAEIIIPFVVKDTVVVLEGMVLNLESGEVDKGAAADTALMGVAVSAVDNTDDGESVKVIVNPFAVYAVTDANVRVAGALLDLDSAATGLTTASSNTFIVVRDSAATEDTLVMFNQTHVWR